MDEYVELIHDLERDYDDYEYDINLSQDIYNAAEAVKSLIAMNEYLNELNKKLANELAQTTELLERRSSEPD